MSLFPRYCQLTVQVAHGLNGWKRDDIAVEHTWLRIVRSADRTTVRNNTTFQPMNPQSVSKPV